MSRGFPRSVCAPVLVGAGVFFAAWFTRRAHSLSFDELFTVWVASRPWADLVHQTSLDGFTPPLFYAIVKLVSLAGLRLEDLRIVPALFAALAVGMGVHASERAFGARARGPAIVLLGASAWVLSFAHELRPYSLLMAAAFYVLGELSRPDGAVRDRVAGAALVATAASYLGLFLVVLWVVESRRRQPWSRLVGVLLTGLGLCLPAALKVVRMSLASSTISWLPEAPSFSRVFFGLASTPVAPWIEALAVCGLGLALWLAIRSGDVSLRFWARAFVLLTALILALDAVVRIGFAPRYAVLSVSALLLLVIGLIARAGRARLGVASGLLALNLLALQRYLAPESAPRENWRGAMGAVTARLGPSGTLVAFPFHHAAVAAAAYAPELRVGGGYASRSGPVYWYEPPAAFKGYDFADLRAIDDVGAVFDRLAPARDVCLLSDEPDATKTARVFEAFAAEGLVAPLETGDSRIRVVCRLTRAGSASPR